MLRYHTKTMYYIPLLLTIIANVLYHIAQKSTSEKINPMFSLIITYGIAFTMSCILFCFMKGEKSFSLNVKELNWSSFLLGCSVILLELGYLLSYRVGWNIGTASFVSTIAVTLVLIPIGLLFKGVCSFDASLAGDIPRVVKLLAKGLRMIHNLDICDCPVKKTLDIRIEEAKFRSMKGLVDEADFDLIRQGRKAEDLYRELLDKRPDTEDLVFTHGDYCLPNILIDNWEIGGFIDWSNGGISDRYQDLALASRSLIYNFGKEWVPLFFKEYGLEHVDYEKVEYYRLLDEFF